MSFDELIAYNLKIHKKGKDVDLQELSDYCFHSTYTYSMLQDGYGFSDSTNITVASIINGQKVTWALGSALFEINSLDWTYAPNQVEQGETGGEKRVHCAHTPILTSSRSSQLLWAWGPC